MIKARRDFLVVIVQREGLDDLVLPRDRYRRPPGQPLIDHRRVNLVRHRVRRKEVLLGHQAQLGRLDVREVAANADLLLVPNGLQLVELPEPTLGAVVDPVQELLEVDRPLDVDVRVVPQDLGIDYESPALDDLHYTGLASEQLLLQVLRVLQFDRVHRGVAVFDIAREHRKGVEARAAQVERKEQTYEELGLWLLGLRRLEAIGVFHHLRDPADHAFFFHLLRVLLAHSQVVGPLLFGAHLVGPPDLVDPRAVFDLLHPHLVVDELLGLQDVLARVVTVLYEVPTHVGPVGFHYLPRLPVLEIEVLGHRQNVRVGVK